MIMKQNEDDVQVEDVRFRVDIKQFSSIFFQIDKSIKQVAYLTFLISQSQFCIQFINKSKNMHFQLNIPNSYFTSYDYMHSSKSVSRNFYLKSLVPIYHFFRKGQAHVIINQSKMVIEYQGTYGSQLSTIKTLYSQQINLQQLYFTQNDYDKYLRVTIQKKEHLQSIARPLKRLKAEKISIYYNTQQKSLQIEGTPKLNYQSAEWELKVDNVTFDSKLEGKIQQRFEFDLKNFRGGFALAQSDAPLTLTFYPNFMVIESEKKKKWKIISKVSNLFIEQE